MNILIDLMQYRSNKRLKTYNALITDFEKIAWNNLFTANRNELTQVTSKLFLMTQIKSGALNAPRLLHIEYVALTFHKLFPVFPSHDRSHMVEMCKNHDEMLRCIPAIQPISNKDLRKTASGYGTRIDPIYGDRKSVV